MAGLAIITEACIDVKDRACVDVCPVQCIYEFDPAKNQLFSEEEAGSGVVNSSGALASILPRVTKIHPSLPWNVTPCGGSFAHPSGGVRPFRSA